MSVRSEGSHTLLSAAAKVGIALAVTNRNAENDWSNQYPYQNPYIRTLAIVLVSSAFRYIRSNLSIDRKQKIEHWSVDTIFRTPFISFLAASGTELTFLAGFLEFMNWRYEVGRYLKWCKKNYKETSAWTKPESQGEFAGGGSNSYYDELNDVLVGKYNADLPTFNKEAIIYHIAILAHTYASELKENDQFKNRPEVAEEIAAKFYIDRVRIYINPGLRQIAEYRGEMGNEMRENIKDLEETLKENLRHAKTNLFQSKKDKGYDVDAEIIE